MKRIMAACITAVILVLTITAEFIYNSDSINEISKVMNSAIESFRKGDMDESLKSMKKADQLWDSRSRIMLCFLSHDIPDQIDESLNIALNSLENDNPDIFETESRRVTILLGHLSELEQPTFTNIL